MPNKKFLKMIGALIVISLIFILTIVIYKPMNIETYSSENYTFQYPKSYSIEEPTESSKVLIISGKNGRIEIFKMNDFGGERITGASSTGFEEFEYKYKPKKEYKIEDYTIWIFYLTNDKETEEELNNIYNSFRIKK
jgi:undecaprenyl pyrophosphate synthase